MKTICIFLLSIVGCSPIAGCSNTKVVLPNGTEILTQRVFIKAQAKKAELYYSDPNYMVCIILDDPNTAVNKGKLSAREPRTGAEINLTSE